MSDERYDISETGGNVVGAGAKGVVAGEIAGNVYHINIHNHAVEERVSRIAGIATEVAGGEPAGLPAGASPGDTGALKEGIDELLTLLRARGPAGHANPEIGAGAVHLSRVELLLKKAILLRAEADQLHFDALADHRGGGVSEEVYEAKLKEAYALLKEANAADPADTEVLLHMAKLLMELTPDDPDDEREILYRIRSLLDAPRDDAERFRLAQATFLLATTSEPPHAGMLRDARAAFERLGRTDWTEQADALLAAHSPSAHPGFGGAPAHTGFGGAPAHPGFGGAPAHPGFSAPVVGPGRWQVQIGDAAGSTMTLDLLPDGSFGAVQRAALFPISVQASGHWVFAPAEHTLHLQGVLNGFQPFMLSVMIHSQNGGAFYGIGSDGHGYVLARG